MLKTSQGQWLWMRIVMFISMLKALNTHTHIISPISRLILLISRLISSIVDLLLTIADLASGSDIYQLYVSIMHTMISRLILSPTRLIIVVVDL